MNVFEVAGAGLSSSSEPANSFLIASSPDSGALTITFLTEPKTIFAASTIHECFEPSCANCFNQLGFLIVIITSSADNLTGTACCFKIAREGKLETLSNNFTQVAFNAFGGADFDIGTDSDKTSSSVGAATD